MIFADSEAAHAQDIASIASVVDDDLDLVDRTERICP